VGREFAALTAVAKTAPARPRPRCSPETRRSARVHLPVYRAPVVGPARLEPLPVHLPEGLVRWINLSLTFTLLVICIFVAVDLIKALVRIGRRQLAK